MSGWPSVRLDTVASVIRGVTFGKGDVILAPVEGDIPVLRAGNIDRQLILDDDLVWLPKRVVRESQLLRCHDIVMCMSSGSAAIVGKSALLEKEWTGSFGAFCAAIRAKPAKVEAKFLAHLFQGAAFRCWASAAQGNNIKNLNKSALEGYVFRLPPRDEQRRIVRLLDRAAEIRRRADAARAKARAIIPAVFLDMFGDPATNPNGWPEHALTELCRPRQWKTITGAELLPSGFPVYGANGVIGFYSDYNHEEPVIAVTCRGATCGTVNVTVPRSYVTGNAMCLDDPSPKLELEYLATALRLRGFRDAITGAAQPQITRQALTVVNVPVPPSSLQRAFAEQAQRLEATARALDAAAAKAEAMAAALSAEVFAPEAATTLRDAA
ncbi:hypothetical protein COC42_07865 [Sphingomonas spermidinifaciens]|uniref:Type I restriction modification DNA specificity domain-containing protein n=1 Tax=Sphingomonas spermidinifaciens TaxID=1141889 RepID=A0A2A4B8E2_9SPHN|nr:restriction endonuclease subunit S [Sphingomonas spermidinifaciens]PCD04195.1 hypothetical protein COC42_07865 [Sphingomonas spermidinifaciens]